MCLPQNVLITIIYIPIKRRQTPSSQMLSDSFQILWVSFVQLRPVSYKSNLQELAGCESWLVCQWNTRYYEVTYECEAACSRQVCMTRVTTTTGAQLPSWRHLRLALGETGRTAPCRAGGYKQLPNEFLFTYFATTVYAAERVRARQFNFS